MPDIPEEAVQAAAKALSAHPWNSYPHAAHREHKFDSACAVCRGDLEPIARVILEAAALAGAGQVVVSAEDARAVRRCPNGCGRVSSHPHGGPCGSCWDELGLPERTTDGR